MEDILENVTFTLNPRTEEEESETWTIEKLPRDLVERVVLNPVDGLCFYEEPSPKVFLRPKDLQSGKHYFIYRRKPKQQFRDMLNWQTSVTNGQEDEGLSGIVELVKQKGFRVIALIPAGQKYIDPKNVVTPVELDGAVVSLSETNKVVLWLHENKTRCGVEDFSDVEKKMEKLMQMAAGGHEVLKDLLGVDGEIRGVLSCCTNYREPKKNSSVPQLEEEAQRRGHCLLTPTGSRFSDKNPLLIYPRPKPPPQASLKTQGRRVLLPTQQKRGMNTYQGLAKSSNIGIGMPFAAKHLAWA